jgi:hypothetical protein
LCGLAGVARHPTEGDEALMREALVPLLTSIESRGVHATGVATTLPDGDTGIWKVAAPAKKVVESDVFKRGVLRTLEPGNVMPIIIQGHTRHATHNNAHVDSAAHPFRRGEIVGAHNGIIRNWVSIENDLKLTPKERFQVDSEAVFELLNRNKDPRKALKRLEGYFALSWVKGTELNLVRSMDAVMHCAYLGRHRTLIWNSTKTALEKVLDELGVKSDAFIWETAYDTLYRFDPGVFGEKSANGIKVEVSLSKDRKSFRKWGAATSGMSTQQSLPFTSTPDPLASRVRQLETRLDAMSSALRKLIGKVESVDAETRYILDTLSNAGMLGEEEESVEDRAICEICDKEVLYEDAIVYEDGFVHDKCLFSQKALPAGG